MEYPGHKISLVLVPLLSRQLALSILELRYQENFIQQLDWVFNIEKNRLF